MPAGLFCNAIEMFFQLQVNDLSRRQLAGLEHQAQGKAELFAALRPALAGSRESQPYVELSRQLGLGEGAVRVAVHRLRKRYREVLREVIADTVAEPAEVDEFCYLRRVMAGR